MTTVSRTKGRGGPTDPDLARTPRSDGDRIPLSLLHSDFEGDPREAQTGARPRAIAAPQGLCATASSSSQKASPRVKSELSPLMTLGGGPRRVCGAAPL